MRTLIFTLAIVFSLIGCDKIRRSTQSGQYDGTLFPLALGRAWIYDVKPFGNFTMTCAAGRYTKQVTTERTVDGKQAFDVGPICTPGEGAEVLSVGSVNVESWYQERWIPALPLSPTNGQGWASGPYTYTIYSAGTVSVPAGNFSDCWTRVRTTATGNYATYCRGVGPVEIRHQDVFGNGWSAVLLEKRF